MKQTQLLLQQAPMMKVRSLSKRYVVKKHLFAPTQYFYAVNNVNFDVYPGETLGLVGNHKAFILSSGTESSKGMLLSEQTLANALAVLPADATTSTFLLSCGKRAQTE